MNNEEYQATQNTLLYGELVTGSEQNDYLKAIAISLRELTTLIQQLIKTSEKLE